MVNIPYMDCLGIPTMAVDLMGEKYENTRTEQLKPAMKPQQSKGQAHFIQTLFNPVLTNRTFIYLEDHPRTDVYVVNNHGLIVFVP